MGRFVIWDVLEWDVLSCGMFCDVTFSDGMFHNWTFCIRTDLKFYLALTFRCNLIPSKCTIQLFFGLLG